MKALRKRVLPKSPVRKIRTPGSVRGLPGNRLSYRDMSVKPVTILERSNVIMGGNEDTGHPAGRSR
jgi:hypothetical protein